MNNWKQFRSAYRESLAESNLAEARRYLQMAIERIDEPNQRELAGMYNQVANISLRMNDPVSAEEAVRKAIETEVQFGPPVVESDHMAAHHITLALALRNQDRYAEALLTLDQGIALYSQHLDDDNEVMINLNELRKSIESEKWRERQKGN
jgi:tetratricopeptide (TPR) repeat protein